MQWFQLSQKGLDYSQFRGVPEHPRNEFVFKPPKVENEDEPNDMKD